MAFQQHKKVRAFITFTFSFSLFSLLSLLSFSSHAEQATSAPATHVCEGKLMGDVCEYTDEGVLHHGVCDNQFGAFACGMVSEHGLEPFSASGDLAPETLDALALPQK